MYRYGHRFPLLTRADVIGIGESFGASPSLTDLSIEASPITSEVALETIARDLTHLRRLAVKDCPAVNDAGVNALSVLTALETLELGQCRGFRGFNVNFSPSLRTLDLEVNAGRVSVCL